MMSSLKRLIFQPRAKYSQYWIKGEGNLAFFISQRLGWSLVKLHQFHRLWKSRALYVEDVNPTCHRNAQPVLPLPFNLVGPRWMRGSVNKTLHQAPTNIQDRDGDRHGLIQSIAQGRVGVKWVWVNWINSESTWAQILVMRPNHNWYWSMWSYLAQVIHITQPIFISSASWYLGVCVLIARFFSCGPLACQGLMGFKGGDFLPALEYLKMTIRCTLKDKSQVFNFAWCCPL